MGIGEKASVDCVFALCWLQDIGDQMDLSVQLRDQIQTLRLQLQFLNNIFMCTEHCSEDMELNYFLEGVGKVVSDLHSTLFNGVDRNYGKIHELGSIVMNALENMNVIKTDIVLVYVLFSKLSCSQGRMSDGILLEFLEMSMENLKGLMNSKADLLVPLKEQIGILEEKLRLLRKFFHFARNGYIEQENLGHLATVIGAVVDKVGCLGALYWIDEMDEDMASRLRLKLCKLLQKIELVIPEVKLILIKFQKASMLLQSNKATITNELLWDFVDFIIENLKEFIKGKINLMGFLDDQVKSLHVEFRLLRTSLIKQQLLVKELLSESYRVYIRSNCAIKMVDLLTRTEAVSKEAATIMNSFGIHDTSDEGRALGINFECFDLLEKFIPFCAQGMQDLQSHIMKQRENAQPHEYDPLNCLECQEKYEGLSADLKDAIQRLKMKFGFLQIILRWWSGEDCDLRLIHKVIKASSAYCHNACVAIKYGRLDSALSNLKDVLSYVNNNKELGLRVKEAIYRFQVSSSPSVMIMPAELVGDFVDFLIKNVVYLLHYKLCIISSAKTKMEVLEEKLRFLRGFLGFTSKWCIQSEKLKQLLTRIGTMVDYAAHLCYWCFVDEVKEQMADKVKLITSSLLEMIIPIDIEVREIYPLVLKASESSLPETPTRAELVLAFVDSLMANLMDMHNGKVCGMIPRWESWQIQTLCQGLRFLKAMIKDLSDQGIEHNKLNNLFIYIETEVSKIGPGTRKMNVEVLNFLVVIKLIKADIYLKEVESSKSILTVSLKEETATLSKELKSLITEVLGLVDYYTNLDKLNDHLRCIEAVADQLQSVRYLFCMQNLNEESDRMMRFAMLEFLVKVRTIMAGVSLVKLLDKKSGSVVPVKDKIETLKEELEFLVNHLGQYSEPEKLNNLLIDIDDIVSQTGSTVDSFNLNEINEEIVSKVNIGISDLLEKIELIKKHGGQICHKFPDLKLTYVPRTAELCFIDYLIEKLKRFLDCKGNVISQLKNQIERVQGELMSMRYLIGDVAHKSNEHEEMKDLFTRSLYVAYEVEYVVGLSVSGIGDTFLYHRLCNATKEIILTKTKIMEMYEKKNGVSSNSFTVTDKIQGASNVKSGIVDDVVVGFKDVVEMILDKLVKGSSQRDVISIVGMPGIGKTTVARKIYNICVNECHFDVCSWCCVSMEYVKKELLVDLLCQIVELPDKIDDMPEYALSEKLKKGLMEKRYLIIIDDIWSTEAWEDLQRHFPDDKPGSRIIITTRIKEVAQNAKGYSDPHCLRFLEDKESWMLLQEKLQFKESHQPDLVDIGKQIAKKCHGLPLSVVLVAGLLSRVEMTPGCWRQVSESLSVVSVVGDTIELSYKHLPEHLKRCFLYFGVFSEDKEIPVSKLTWLWIAEGFVLEKDLKSSEEVAEEYLMDLIGRNLVINSKNKSRGKVKACRVHDAVRNFCLLKSKEEDFLQRVHGTCSPHGFPQEPEQHRIFVYSKQEDFANWRPSDLPVRSLLFKAVSSYVPPYDSFDISFVLRQFKLLLVLDLGSLNMGSSFPTEVKLLIHLRYLAVRIDTSSIPSFIDKLQNLETFLVKGGRGEISLPDTLWNMVRLRHLHVDNRASFGLHRKEFFEYSYHLDNLKTFSSPTLGRGEDSKKIMRRLPNLQKLRCWFMESWEGFSKREKRNQFPALDFLAQLESLKVFYCGHQVLHPCEFNFPSNLKKLTLINFRLPWSEISKIAESLTNLEILYLKFRACNDERWEVGYGEFPNLKFLKLDRLNIVKWNAKDDAFPRLQQLVLRKCKHLEEIPESMGFMTTLQTIDVQWCTHSAVNSAIQIWKNQLDELGNDGFKVSIQPLDCDPRASPFGLLFNSE